MGSSAERPDASVVVVNFNGEGVLARCLDHLVAQDHPSFEIVLVDDGSTDGSLEVASRYLASGKLTIVRSPSNRGCAAARNLGLCHAQGRIIAFVDADGYAAPQWLGHAVRALDRDSSVGAVASLVFFARNPLVLNGAGGTINRSGFGGDLCIHEPYEFARLPHEVVYPMGCGMVIKRAVLDRIGGFDPVYRNYYDDVDLGIRIWRSGYRIVLASEAWIDHDFGHSGGPSEKKRTLCERHRIRTVLKHFAVSSLPRWLAREIRSLADLSKDERRTRLRAAAWNLARLPELLLHRMRWAGLPRLPKNLIDPSWGYLPTRAPDVLECAPEPEAAKSPLMLGMDDDSVALHYGWYFRERDRERTFRWANGNASLVLRAARPVHSVSLEYGFPPSSTGTVRVAIRSVDGEPTSWEGILPHHDIPWRREAYPVQLAPGDYFVTFRSEQTWQETAPLGRALGFALANIAFEDS